MEIWQIQDDKSLRAWLANKSKEYSQVIALRAALRVLPFISISNEPWLKNFALLPFAAVITSWMQLSDESIFVRTEESRANARFGGHSFDFDSYNAARLAALAADACYHSADAQSKSHHALNDCVYAVRNAAKAFREVFQQRFIEDYNLKPAGDEAFWFSVERDCKWLGSTDPIGLAKELNQNELWQNGASVYWKQDWSNCSAKLCAVDPSYSVWIDWYERRIRGEHAAFDIPGDQNRAEDKAILRRLAEATNQDFWGKGHEYVNATLKGWLDEARSRVALPTIIAEAFSTFDITGVSKAEPSLLLPPQNRNAISFKQDEAGRIAIDAGASADQLRNNADARDRHAEAISEARALLNRCNGNNAAARLTQRLENYLDAAGTSVDDIKPSLIVQRGERLRQELAAYAVPGTLLDPIADDILIDLRGWQSAHNMLVGLDPVLMAIDTSMIGPDRRPEMMSPDEIRQFVHDAQVKGLLADGTEAILIETADLASAVPGANDRRANASIEMVRNLCIETVSIALNHPIGTAASVAICVAASSSITSGAISGVSIMGSIKAAEYLINHRPWIEGKFGNTSTWQALFAKIADWLEKNTPFQPK